MLTSTRILSFFSKKRTPHSRTAARTVQGRTAPRNSPIEMPELEYRYRFCGFPTGVAILPRLAAMVSSTVIFNRLFSFPVI